MTDIPEKDSERTKKELPEKKKTKGLMGLRPKYLVVDEILRMPDEDSEINRSRLEFYSKELPTGYEPPFPTGRAEEKMAELNEHPERFSSERFFESKNPFSPRAMQILRETKGYPLPEIKESESGELFFPVDKTDLVPDLDVHDIYEKLNKDLGPEPPGGDVA